MKKSFSFIELIIVIIVIGILYTSVNFSIKDTALEQAAQQIMSHINYTRFIAIKDNKMQYYPINNSATEMNRSKYWFKQWWQIRFSQRDNGEYFYEVFSDLPSSKENTNFDRVGDLVNEFAINPLNYKYLDANYGSNNDEKLNITKYYGIKVVKINNSILKSNNSFKLIYDYYGNCYLSEGEKGDGGDINPYNIEKRIPLLAEFRIILCKDDNCEINKTICITPKFGNAYICN